MASILPQSASLAQGIPLPLLHPSDEAEEFQMPDLIQYAGPVRELIELRLACGGGRKDEVREGVYHMSPDSTNSHQRFILRLCTAFVAALDNPESIVQPGGNVSDRNKQWYKNYCCPDVIVILPGNPIQDRKTYYLGGPDLVVEVLSPDDESVEKLPFYAKLGTREVLHIDPETKTLTLFALRNGAMEAVGSSSTDLSQIVTSQVLPTSFQVQSENDRPILVVQHTNKPELRWVI